MIKFDGKTILLVVLLLAYAFYKYDGHQEEVTLQTFESDHTGYLNDLMDNNFVSIAERFTYPVTFTLKFNTVLPSTVTFENKGQLIVHYQSVKGRTPGYAYYTIDKYELTERGDSFTADVSYRRFNEKNESMGLGGGRYSFRNVDGGWKISSFVPPNVIRYRTSNAKAPPPEALQL
jgi:hypothetical protein